MYNLITNFEPSNEIFDVVRQFEQYISNSVIEHTVKVKNSVVNNLIKIDGVCYDFSDVLIFSGDDLLEKRDYKRKCKSAVYFALRNHTKVKMPWGSLTGIRPTKLAYEYLDDGGNIDELEEFMLKKYDLTPQKSNLLKKIVLCQAEYMVDPERYVNLYVHIPFCTTKCTYCSFVTHIVDKHRCYLAEYTDRLCEEISNSINIIRDSGQEIYSIYIGGGTPTALDDDNLEKVLKACSGFNVEFTCEAGRPDTITESKFNLMKKYGVTRVCVNPQTLNQKTLDLIGRRHSVSQFFETYKIAKNCGFDVNIDLIAGLQGETFEDFKYSLDEVLKLNPENITVHTLSIKNGSELKNSGGTNNLDVEKMVEYAQNVVCQYGYDPYYLYRQKQMLGNFENVGYCRKGKQCANNITTMEERLSVVACGAGAISKRVFASQNRIERYANLRDVKLYLENFDEREQKKANFFKN